ncbi:YqzK family protein [Brevibacillus sp. H7]|uniref:YqzK family protein n=1 Tax=Brevibacillus sp. H7 TaxID=3349138 RepID=UPI00380AB6DE
MGVPYRRVMEALRFFLLFVTCTLLSYGLINLLSDKFLPADPYREPHGNAVKVVKLINTPSAQSLDGYVSRLQLFYLTGE